MIHDGDARRQETKGESLLGKGDNGGERITPLQEQLRSQPRWCRPKMTRPFARQVSRDPSVRQPGTYLDSTLVLFSVVLVELSSFCVGGTVCQFLSTVNNQAIPSNTRLVTRHPPYSFRDGSAHSTSPTTSSLYVIELAGT